MICYYKANLYYEAILSCTLNEMQFSYYRDLHVPENDAMLMHLKWFMEIIDIQLFFFNGTLKLKQQVQYFCNRIRQR